MKNKLIELWNSDLTRKEIADVLGVSKHWVIKYSRVLNLSHKPKEKWSKYKYSKDIIIEIVKNSTSIRQVLIGLGLVGCGGNYRCIHRVIKEYNIDISHFTGCGWLRGNNHNYTKVTPEQYLIYNENSHRTSYRITK
jgi:5-methylcytosine-specific restriction endonuclease McrA